MKAIENGVKSAFLLLVLTSRQICVMAILAKSNYQNIKAFFYMPERYQNNLIVPSSKEVGIVKMPYLTI